MKQMKKELTLAKRRSIAGIAFISPFLIGAVLIFIPSIIQSFLFSINELQIDPSGFELKFQGIAYYKEALLEHAKFSKSLITSVVNMLINIPLVIVFSFFISNILNTEFKGRTAVRAILFLPVIVSSGVLLSLSSVSVVDGVLTTGSNTSESVSAVDLSNLLVTIGLPAGIITYLSQAISRLYEVINSSGVQILIFLAALQTISPAIYEAATIDGCTAWEKFWKITFPMLSPYILTNTIYSLIDLLSSEKSEVLGIVISTAQQNINYSLSAAMAFIFFATVVVILAVFALLISRLVFYYD